MIRDHNSPGFPETIPVYMISVTAPQYTGPFIVLNLNIIGFMVFNNFYKRISNP